jgi:quercetin dioxygenase-like cupin family protein
MSTKLFENRRHLILGPESNRLRGSATTSSKLRLAAIAISIALAWTAPAEAQKIAIEKLDIAAAKAGRSAGVQIRPVMVGEIKEVRADLVSIAGPGRHVEPSSPSQAVVWLFLDGKGTLQTRGQTFAIDGETIARAPQGWDWRIDVAKGDVLYAVRISRDLTAVDLAELKKYPQNNVAPHVKKFSECPAYGEAIKSAKTVSRTLLPENFVPRMAMGTVETTGPDTVGAHRHPMLEQLFLGLRENDITVIADEARANLTPFSILHIPLGSNHGAKVAAGRKLHYIWMDFFASKEGQEWLKMHKPLDPRKKP